MLGTSALRFPRLALDHVYTDTPVFQLDWRHIPGWLPQPFESMLTMLRFRIDSDHKLAIQAHAARAVAEHVPQRGDFPDHLASIVEQPAVAHVTAAFDLLTDCLWNPSTSTWDRVGRWRIAEMMRARFWSAQTEPSRLRLHVGAVVPAGHAKSEPKQTTPDDIVWLHALDEMAARPFGYHFDGKMNIPFSSPITGALAGVISAAANASPEARLAITQAIGKSNATTLAALREAYPHLFPMEPARNVPPGSVQAGPVDLGALRGKRAVPHAERIHYAEDVSLTGQVVDFHPVGYSCEPVPGLEDAGPDGQPVFGVDELQPEDRVAQLEAENAALADGLRVLHAASTTGRDWCAVAEAWSRPEVANAAKLVPGLEGGQPLDGPPRRR